MKRDDILITRTLYSNYPMAGGFGHILRKEVRTMRITFHIGPYTVTITVKETHKKNRHSAK